MLNIPHRESRLALYAMNHGSRPLILTKSAMKRFKSKRAQTFFGLKNFGKKFSSVASMPPWAANAPESSGGS
jgi:hypothetical protein